MSPKRPDTATVGVLGAGAAACAVCCAGPVLGFLAAAGLLTAGGVALFGAAGLLLVVPVAMWFRRRRSTRMTCATPEETVPVQLSQRPTRATAATSDASATNDGEAVSTR